MNMNFAKLAVAGAVAVACSGAWAEDNAVTNIDLSSGTAFFGTLHFQAGAFTDTFSFVNPPAGPAYDVSGSLVSIALSGGQNIDFYSADLNGVPFVLSPNGAFEFGSLSASGVTGPLMITVSGLATGVGGGSAASYSGTLNVTPVPEPETYALMLAGLGAIGFMASRRRRQG